MAIIKCPECGENVSDTCTTCIHCGYKLKQPQQTSTVVPDDNSATNISQSRSIQTPKYFYAISMVVLFVVFILNLVGIIIGWTSDYIAEFWMRIPSIVLTCASMIGIMFAVKPKQFLKNSNLFHIIGVFSLFISFIINFISMFISWYSSAISGYWMQIPVLILLFISSVMFVISFYKIYKK